MVLFIQRMKVIILEDKEAHVMNDIGAEGQGSS